MEVAKRHLKEMALSMSWRFVRNAKKPLSCNGEKVIRENSTSLNQYSAIKAKRAKRQFIEVLKWETGIMANSDDGEMAKSMMCYFKASMVRRIANKLKRVKC
jgi:hypothetical protein